MDLNVLIGSQTADRDIELVLLLQSLL